MSIILKYDWNVSRFSWQRATKLWLIFCSSHKADTGGKKQKSEDGVNYKRLSISGSPRCIYKQNGIIYEPNYAEQGKKSAKNSFNIHNIYLKKYFVNKLRFNLPGAGFSLSGSALQRYFLGRVLASGGNGKSALSHATQSYLSRFGPLLCNSYHNLHYLQ